MLQRPCCMLAKVMLLSRHLSWLAWREAVGILYRRHLHMSWRGGGDELFNDKRSYHQKAKACREGWR